jgi:hypothetical protein
VENRKFKGTEDSDDIIKNKAYNEGDECRGQKRNWQKVSSGTEKENWETAGER